MPDTSNIFLLDNYFFNIHSIPVALTALVVLIFGLAIFIREKASYVGWLFLAYSATFFLWFSGITLVYSAMSPEIALHWIKYANSGVALIPPTFYLLSVVVLNEYSRHKIFVSLSWFVAVIMLLLLQYSDNYITGIHHYYWGRFVSLGTTSFLFLAFFLIVITRTIYMYWQALRNAPEKSTARKRARLLLSGFLVGSLAAVDFLPAYGFESYPFGFIFILYLYINTIIVFWHYRLNDITPEFASMQIFETMEEALIILDTDNIIRLINSSANQLFGKQNSALLNQHIISSIPEVNFKRLNTLLTASGQLSHHEIHVAISPDQGIFLEVSARIIYNQKKNIIGYLYLMHDRTIQREAEIILQRDKDELKNIVDKRTKELLIEKENAETANRAKTHFLSVMSHELRTPLNAVLGFSQLLETSKKEPLTETQASNVREIKHSGEQLLHLITDNLDLSRIESGNLEISLEELNLYELLNRITNQVAVGIASQKSITINNNYNNNSQIIIADKMRIMQVLLNILNNAVKYNRDDGYVNINAITTTDNNVKISVTDSGHGIKKEYLTKIFDPFERLEQSHGSIEGSGVGLTVSKQLIDAMNGSIGVESTYGEGSTFWIKIPGGKVSGIPG